LINLILLGDVHKLCRFSLCSFLHPPVSWSLFGPNILFNTLFSNTLGLYSSLNFRDHIWHTYRTTDKIIVSYSPIFEFFDSRQEDRRFWTAWCLVTRRQNKIGL
jgi:hypothetical protein